MITVSSRAAAGVYEDKSGPIIADALAELGFEVWGPRVVPDGDAVGEALRAALSEGADVVITTGGTGLNPTDATPEQTAALLDRQLPYLAAEIARYGVAAWGADGDAEPRTGGHVRAYGDRQSSRLQRWCPGRNGRARTGAAARRRPAQRRRPLRWGPDSGSPGRDRS